MKEMQLICDQMYKRKGDGKIVTDQCAMARQTCPWLAFFCKKDTAREFQIEFCEWGVDSWCDVKGVFRR